MSTERSFQQAQQRRLQMPGDRPATQGAGDAADELEREAAQEYRVSREAQLPETVEQLMAATFGVAGRSGLSELHTRFVRDEHVLLATTVLEQRLDRYLRDEDSGEPSRFAEVLVHAAKGIEQLSDTDRRLLQELQLYSTSELSPLITKLHQAVAANVSERDPLHSADGVLEELSHGEVSQGGWREQRTVSAIGIMRMLAEASDDIADIRIGETEYPQRMVVEQPFGEASHEYWSERAQCAELYGRTEMNQMIAWRTRHLQELLDEAAETLPNRDTDEDQRRLYAAYGIIEDWLDIHAEAMERPLRINDSDVDRATYEYYIARMDFTHGDTAEIIDVLNAAEIIKQHNPELFIRMLGIAPGANGVAEEARRSDLFGSAFHVAMYRTLQFDHPRYKILHDKASELLEVSAEGAPLARLNGEQIRQIVSKFKDAVTADEHDATLTTIMATMLGGLAMRHPREVALAMMLNSVEQESRTEQLERMRVASPHDFYVMMQQIPEAALEDGEILEVIRERMNLDDTHAASQQLEAARTWHASYRFGKGKAYEQYSWDAKMVLWQTAPDETLLTQDFMTYVSQIRVNARLMSDLADENVKWQRITGLETRHIDREDSPEVARIVLTTLNSVLDAHQSISKSQWMDWLAREDVRVKDTVILNRIDAKHQLIDELASNFEFSGMSSFAQQSSFRVLFGPQVTMAIDEQGQRISQKQRLAYDPKREPGSYDGPLHRKPLKWIKAAQLERRQMSIPDEIDVEMMRAFRTAYTIMTTEAFIDKYRYQLVRLGADYILGLREVASDTDFADLMERLYFNTEEHIPEHYRGKSIKDGWWPVHAYYPEEIDATNAWQFEVYDAMERIVDEDPAAADVFVDIMQRIDNEFFTRTDFTLRGVYNWGSAHGTVTIQRERYQGNKVNAYPTVQWTLSESRDTTHGSMSEQYRYDSAKREIAKSY